MKKLIALLSLLPLLAVGAPNDLLISQRNSTDTGTIARTVAVPLGGENGILAFNGASVLPVTVTLGNNLAMVGGVLNAPLTVGPQGPQGIPGAASTVPGPQGLIGLTGATGAQGAKGDTGSQGIQGATGLTGSVGPQGLTGAAGAQGIQGPVGATGPQGPSGISKRLETYTGTTNASGQVVVTYPVAFSQSPNVQTPPPALANQVWTVTASSTTGFTAVLSQRNVVTLLGLEVLLGAVVPVSGSTAQIVVIER